MELNDQQFEQLVSEAWEAIPSQFKDEMKNLSVFVEMRPTMAQLRRLKVKGVLLGLFEGVPITRWGQSSMGMQPGKITIFQEPIVKYSRDIKQLRITIQVVLMHEVAHYFGFNEDDMFVMDRKLRKKLK